MKKYGLLGRKLLHSLSPEIHRELGNARYDLFQLEPNELDEFFEKKDKINTEPWMIAPEPETYVEMRLVVWETENMKCLDVEGTSDIFINGYIQPNQKQSTDVHFRSQNGVGSFNWRMVFPLSLPKDNKVLTIQAYDNDLFKRNDFICGGTLDLRDLMKIPKDLDIPISFTKSYVDGCSDSQRVKYENIQFLQ